MFPTVSHLYEYRAQIRSHLGLHAAARADAEAAIASTEATLGLAVLAFVAARAGDTAAARRAAERVLVGDRAIHHEGTMWLIGSLIALGDTARALDLLEPQREALGPVYFRHLVRQPDFDPVPATRACEPFSLELLRRRPRRYRAGRGRPPRGRGASSRHH